MDLDQLTARERLALEQERAKLNENEKAYLNRRCDFLRSENAYSEQCELKLVRAIKDTPQRYLADAVRPIQDQAIYEARAMEEAQTHAKADEILLARLETERKEQTEQARKAEDLKQQESDKQALEQKEAEAKKVAGQETEKARASQPEPTKEAESKEPADRVRERGLRMFERFDAIRDREAKAYANEQAIDRAREAAQTRANHARHEPLKDIEPSRLSDNPLMEKNSDGKAEQKGEMTDSKSARFARMFSSESAQTKEMFDGTHNPSNAHNFVRDGKGGRDGL